MGYNALASNTRAPNYTRLGSFPPSLKCETIAWPRILDKISKFSKFPFPNSEIVP